LKSQKRRSSGFLRNGLVLDRGTIFIIQQY
jgi:hypothetical protein